MKLPFEIFSQKVLQFLVILFAFIIGIYYQQILDFSIKHFESYLFEKPIDIHYESQSKLNANDKLFTKLELAKYNGEDATPIYLAILGSVYDVSKGIKHYGPGCSYNYFVGRDASISFVTGEFEKFVEDEADDVLKLKQNDLLSLYNWKKFYDKDYIYKGKLIGRFYDKNGQMTAYNQKFMHLVELEKKNKLVKEQLSLKYPDCNIEWSQEKGSHVWCTTNSGGKQRDWIGYPRKFFEVGSNTYRCACMQKNELDTTVVMIKPYENCEPLSHECYYHVD